MAYYIENGGLWEEEFSQGISVGQRPIELTPVEQFLLDQIIELQDQIAGLQKI